MHCIEVDKELIVIHTIKSFNEILNQAVISLDDLSAFEMVSDNSELTDDQKVALLTFWQTDHETVSASH